VLPNYPDKPTGEQRQERERNNATQQTHPGNSIENRPLKKSAAGIFCHLIEPTTVSRTGPVNLRSLSRGALRG